MICLLSPAKTLDFETSAKVKTFTEPDLISKSAALMKLLKTHTADELGQLMSLSEKLSELNVQRNKDWSDKHTTENAKAAVYAFQGDVYQGLAVDGLSATEVRRCQKHLRILSGLYGVLRPLDLIQPYRLEMGSKLASSAGKDLYSFWGDTIRDVISSELKKLKSDLLINLASNEYSRAAKLKTIDANIVTPQFRDWKNGDYKMISFFAKRARGAMVRFLVVNKVTTASGIEDFDLDGYRFNKTLSSENNPVFTRKK